MPEPAVQPNNPDTPATPPVAPVAKPPVSPIKVEPWTAKVFTRDDLKGHATLGKFKSADDMGASYLALEKKLGDGSRVSVPGPEATDAERAEFYKALGRPETAENYSVAAKIKELLPEGTPVNEPFVKGAFETFHKIGLNDAQATAVVSFFAEQQNAAMHVDAQAIEAGVTEVKQEWGHDYDRKLAVAGAAIDQLADGEFKIPGLAELFDPEKGDPRIGSNPVLMKLFYQLGVWMGEDKLVEGQERNEEQIGNLAQKKAELMKGGGPYWNAGHADHKSYVDQVKQINEQLSGGTSA